MKDRKNRAIARGIQKFVRVPTGGECTSFRLTVADDAGDNQIRIVESGAVGVGQRIAQFPTFVNGAGSFRRYVTGNSVGPGELAKQPLQSVPAALNRRIVLRVGPLQIGLRH